LSKKDFVTKSETLSRDKTGTKEYLNEKKTRDLMFALDKRLFVCGNTAN